MYVQKIDCSKHNDNEEAYIIFSANKKCYSGDTSIKRIRHGDPWQLFGITGPIDING